MSTPKEWRGVSIGAKLTRVLGGTCFLHSYGFTTATVRFPNGSLVTMTHNELYKRYKPS
jgi:hypothetical protein